MCTQYFRICTSSALRDQGVGADTDFTLASGADFVVMHFDVQAHGFHGSTHGATQVVQGVDRRHREVAAFNARAVADVVAVEIFAGNPGGFFGVDFVHGACTCRSSTYGIEYEELGLRAEQSGVGDAGGLQVLFGAAGNGAGIALVALHGGGFDDVAGDVDCGFFGERIDHRGAVVRHQDHVGFVDAFPAGDG